MTLPICYFSLPVAKMPFFLLLLYDLVLWLGKLSERAQRSAHRRKEKKDHAFHATFTGTGLNFYI